VSAIHTGAASQRNIPATTVWAHGDFAVHPLAFATPLIDGRAAMLAMCLAFLEAQTSIWIGGWSMYARLQLVRGQDQRAGQDGAPDQYALLDHLRAAGLDSDAIALWRANGLALVDVLGLAVRRGVDVRVLLWDPLDPWDLGHLGNDPVVQAAILADQDIQYRLDKNCRSPLHIAQGLHQKCSVVDNEVAFVGGIDLTVDYGGDFDRWDVSDHPFESELRATERGDSPHPWHDAHVMLTGAAVLDVERNLSERWDASAGRVQQRIQPLRMQVRGIQGAINSGDRPQAYNLAAPEEAAPANAESPAAPGADNADAGRIQIIRTIPALTYRFAPGGIYGIAEAYQQAVNQAERFIYLESQYLWPEVYRGIDTLLWGGRSAELEAFLDALGDALQRGVAVGIILPDHPNCGRRFTDDGIERLRARAADADAAGRLLTLTLGADALNEEAPGGMFYRPVYVHAKVGIVDDQWLTVGSANLNSRGFGGDAEMNISLADPRVAAEMRVALWMEHLQAALQEGEALRDVAAGFSALREQAEANFARVNARQAMQGHALPYITIAEGERRGVSVDPDHGWLDCMEGGSGATPEVYQGRYL